VSAALTEERAGELAQEWIAAWNGHELDAIMRLYAPGVVFQTPTAIASLGIADGRLEGRERLREHFARGLQRLPDLHFELEQLHVGVRSVAITYRWRDGTSVCEVHEYDGGELIERVQALYRGLDW
jgi:ketosteroid isomerase-like protein